MVFLDALASLVRCASISWIHVGESVSESLIHVFEILSTLGHIISVCSGYVQGMFRVCSGYVQGMFTVCSWCVHGVTGCV